MTSRFDAGGLLSTDVELVDLGSHHGLRIEGTVVRRTLRIGLGGRRGLRIEIARARPTSIRAIGPAGEQVQRLPANPDPWLETVQRVAALTVAAALLRWALPSRGRFLG